MFRFLCCFCFVLILFSTSANAQNDIFLSTFFSGDSVMLRWVPANPEVWKAGNTNGFLIERFEADAYFDLQGQNPEGKGTLIAAVPIKQIRFGINCVNPIRIILWFLTRSTENELLIRRKS
jgi:hypothetical protein